MNYSKASFCTYLLLIVSLLALGQGPDNTWLNQNDRINRFEGTYTRKVANPSIELVSLTAQFEDYEFGKNQSLKVGYFLPDSSDYFLKAEELQPTLYYWMQDKNTTGKQGWNHFEKWPVDAWLKRLSIPADNLGIIVKIGDKNSDVIAPCFIYHSHSIDTVQYYVAKFRLGQSVSGGRAVLYKGMHLKRIPPEQDRLYSFTIRSKSGGSYFPVTIRKKFLSDEPGWYTLTLELSKIGSTQKIPYTFSFFHQPNLSK